MKLNTTMPKALQPFYKQELIKAINAFDKKYFQVSWRHLERAHILAQPYPLEHTAGQIPRLLVGGVKSFVGHIPVGNTGGANVPPLKPMEIPDDLTVIINKNNHR